MRWLIGLLLLLLTVVSSQATTWKCTKDSQFIQTQAYMTAGVCVPTGTYGGPGGDALGAAATTAATAIAVCHSGTQTLIDLVVAPSPDSGATKTPWVSFDHTNNKVQCWTAAPGCSGQVTLTAGAATVTTGCAATLVGGTSTVFCTDTTAAAAVKCVATAGTLTVAGTGTDVINYFVPPVVVGINDVPLVECTTAETPTRFRFYAICK